MASQLDEFGPARGSSLVIDPESIGEHKLTLSASRASFMWRSHPQVRGIPLLNFTKLTVLEDRLLGAGSSARVYEGRWCGAK